MPAKLVRLRIGFTAPVLKNIAIFIVHLPEDIALKAIDAANVLRALILPYSPDVANRIVAQVTERPGTA